MYLQIFKTKNYISGRGLFVKLRKFQHRYLPKIYSYKKERVRNSIQVLICRGLLLLYSFSLKTFYFLPSFTIQWVYNLFSVMILGQKFYIGKRDKYVIVILLLFSKGVKLSWLSWLCKAKKTPMIIPTTTVLPLLLVVVQMRRLFKTFQLV